MNSNQEFQTEEEIENDFKQQLPNLDKQNYDFENELTDYLQYTLTNSKRDNETSGISLLKELEDKWENIEKTKQKNIPTKNILNHKQNDTKHLNKIHNHNKKLINECKSKFFKKIQENKNKYFSSIDEFEIFANEMISKMDTIQKQNNQLKSQIQNESNSQVNNYNRDIKNENVENKTKTNNTFKNKPRTKSFLQPDDNVYNINNNNLPQHKQNSSYSQNQYSNSQYESGNLFACKELTSIEGLVYETPTIQSDNNNHHQKNTSSHNYAISESLAVKLKNVFNDITAPSPNEQQFNNYNNQILSNNFFMQNDSTEYDAMSNNNQIDNFNNNNKIISQSSTLHALEKNFDEILSNINPNLNTRPVNKHILIPQQEEIKNNNNMNEEDEYFENLRKEAGYNRGLNQKTLKENTSYTVLEGLNDKKLSKKLEANIKLLNDVMSNENTIKRNYKNNDLLYNKTQLINNGTLNKTRSLSVFSNSNNNSNAMIFDKNRIYSTNRFDNALNKIYKANALKIHKLLNSNSNNNIFNK